MKELNAKVSCCDSVEEMEHVGCSCRYCPIGFGKYCVKEGKDTSYLCEAHYQEYLKKGSLW